ncbi:hypothetical protein [Flavobacterium sp. H122]|uniref:hypothetical protein n=1 Tax=Flavobacterium sp. H122 TaxID=2529860 RepID=UPI0010AA23D1|nr:hypothetical protein [Flavobacterium sp. H122]
MKKIILSVLFLINSFLIFSQEDIKAKIVIDEDSNLQVNQFFGRKTKGVYLFSKDILLNPKEVISLKENEKLKECELQNVDNINFNVVTDKKTINDDFFITTSKYVGFEKESYLKLKNYNLDISSSKYKIIFPTADDLKYKYTLSPKIVAGDFNFFEANGFQVYYLEKETQYLDEMKRANIGMEKSFQFYSKYFGEKKKPKIVFAPVNASSETNENLIVYDSDVIKGKNRSNSISHEIAHIWFGQDGLIFKERPLTEGIAEFLSMHYILSQYGGSRLNRSINDRLFFLEGQNSLKILQKNNLDDKSKHFLSYSLIPMYLYIRQLNDSNFIYDLANLYKHKIDKRKTSLDEINDFFLTKGIKIIDTGEIFPDLFISEWNNDEVCIVSNSDRNLEVEIGILNAGIQTSKKTLSFSKNQNKQTIKTENIDKIIIDPEYKILQVSRLNDVWNKNDANIFNKNRYFKIDLDTEIESFSNEIANYLSGKAEAFLSNIKINDQLLNELKEIKKDYANTTVTGGSASFSKKNNLLYLNIVFFDEAKKETKIAKIDFQFVADKSSVISLSTSRLKNSKINLNDND